KRRQVEDEELRGSRLDETLNVEGFSNGRIDDVGRASCIDQIISASPDDKQGAVVDLRMSRKVVGDLLAHVIDGDRERSIVIGKEICGSGASKGERICVVGASIERIPHSGMGGHGGGELLDPDTEVFLCCGKSVDAISEATIRVIERGTRKADIEFVL